MECSAKNGKSVQEVFTKLTKMMKEKFIDEKLKEGDDPDLTVKKGAFHLLNIGKNIHNKCCN